MTCDHPETATAQSGIRVCARCGAPLPYALDAPESPSLIDWLRAQLDEDERLANAAAGGYPHWRADDDGDVSAEGTGGNGYLANGPWGGSLHDAGHHMARHDPARVLAEVDAKRRLLDVIAEMKPGSWSRQNFRNGKPGTFVGRKLPDQRPALLRLLALPYADRPGYRSEWAP